jgi:hypothetical protein
MRKLIKLTSVLLTAGIFLASCEGPMGPQGPAGKDGANGIDANQTCTECHTSSAQIELKQAQWRNSLHATGENAAYANRTGCVRCHVSQGFLEYVAEGSDANLSIPDEPMQINCYTCHKIHSTYTSNDWELTKPGAEALILKYGGSTVTYDYGNSNQCVACHQARDVSPAPVYNGDDFAITSSRIGVHHSPVSNFLLGKIPFELPGIAYPTTNPHLKGSSESCITCHMAQPYGYMAGDHTWNMTYSAHGGPETLNTNGCLTCHADAAGVVTDFEDLQALVTAKLDTLKNQLVAAGVYNTSNDLAKTGTFKANAVLAYLNYDAVVQDKSLGVHNPAYIQALLNNSIAAMSKLGYPTTGD